MLLVVDKVISERTLRPTFKLLVTDANYKTRKGQITVRGGGEYHTSHRKASIWVIEEHFGVVRDFGKEERKIRNRVMYAYIEMAVALMTSNIRREKLHERNRGKENSIQ